MTMQSLLNGKAHYICVREGHTSVAQFEEHSYVSQHSWNYASCIIPMQPNREHKISIQMFRGVYKNIYVKSPKWCAGD